MPAREKNRAMVRSLLLRFRMASKTTHRRQFASDNYAGICPEAFSAMAEANAGHEPGYGEDSWTARASSLMRDVFETECEVFFVFNGTAANSLSLASLCQSYHSILCHEHRAHRDGGVRRAGIFFQRQQGAAGAGRERKN